MRGSYSLFLYIFLSKAAFYYIFNVVMWSKRQIAFDFVA